MARENERLRPETKDEIIRKLASSNAMLVRRNAALELRVSNLREELNRLYIRYGTKSPPMMAITRQVSDKHGISIALLRGFGRTRSVVAARHELMWRIREETGNSYPEIGRFLGDRDHTTILHGYRQHAARLKTANGRAAS